MLRLQNFTNKLAHEHLYNGSSLMALSKRTKVILPGHHPVEYFRDAEPSVPLPQIHHPVPQELEHQQQGNIETAAETDKSSIGELKKPLYFKIAINRSVIGLPWQQRYWAGVLFKRYQPSYRHRPKSIQPKLPINTTIFREASPEVAEMIMQLKEVVRVENVWTVDEYRRMARELLGKKALNPAELQNRRGYFLIDRPLK